jgi:hypothetical protein
MTRRIDSVAVKASNNVYTALTGVAFITCLIALVLIIMKWSDLNGGYEPLFFGMF